MTMHMQPRHMPGLAVQSEDEYDRLADDLCELRSSAAHVRIALEKSRGLRSMSAEKFRLPLRVSLSVLNRDIARLETLCDGWRDSAARWRALASAAGAAGEETR